MHLEFGARGSKPIRDVLGLLVVMGQLVLAAPAASQGSPGARAPGAPPGQHVVPTTVSDQLDYCRQLVEQGAVVATVARCADHAARLIDEGLRRRPTALRRSDAFEDRLVQGGNEIARRLRSLSASDARRAARDLRDVDEAIHSLRRELSRILAAEHVRLSLVSRGGVSLGNWQAGFLFSLTEWAKTRRGVGAMASEPSFATVTGASAGAVNGFAAAVEGCKEPSSSASDSLYYRVWTQLGLFGRHGRPGLFPGAEGGSTAVSLFTDDALDAALRDAASYVGEGGQLPGCSVDYGFVATHLDPTLSPVHVREDGEPVLTTKKLKEKFSVRLEFPETPEEEGSGLRVLNIGPPETSRGDRVYYAGLGHAEEVPLQALLLGVRASGAFPGAFPPVPLTYTEHLPGPDGTVLRRKRVATFIDGGILDNTPVGLAVALDEWRQEAMPMRHSLEGLIPDEPRAYIFMEPLVTSWTAAGKRAADEHQRERDLLKTYLAFAADLLATTTDAQLTNTAERFAFVRRESHDWTQPRLTVPERHMPIAGEQFEHFMAFMELDFRIFDFYVGMADAYVHLEREECLFAPEGAPCVVSAGLERLDRELQDVNPNYRCIRAYYEMEDAQVLKRLETTDLPPECQQLREVSCEAGGDPVGEPSIQAFLASGAVKSEPEEDRCVEPAIANHNFRALLVGMHNYKVWMQSDDYAEADRLDHFFEELSSGEQTERFIYVDLPTHLGRSRGYLSASDVKKGFRSLVQASLEQLAAEQEGISEYALLLGGRPAADLAFGKDYPKRILGLGVAQNGAELVYGRRLMDGPWRWDTTARIFNLEEQDFAADLDPFTSEFYLSTQATRILSPTDLIDFEIGAGWAASETVAYTSRSRGHLAFRSGPRSHLAFVILQRLYLSLNFDYYVVKEVDPDFRDSVVDEWEFNLTGGWRFLY